MDTILGATGHVGSSVAKNLLRMGEDVTIITHDPNKIETWKDKGAEVALVDVHETENLKKVFDKADRLFILNPPASPAEDDNIKEEKSTVYSILNALHGQSITKIVAESTYGAQEGDDIGDLGVLYEMEQGIRETGLRNSIIRAAYYMSNWESALTTAREEGIVYTLYPVDFKLPMVAPDDIGSVAAGLLVDDDGGTYYVEGPERYSSEDVANAYAKALHRSVVAIRIPRDRWVEHLMTQGFSRKAAESMEAMTDITLHEKYEVPESPIRGVTTIDEFISNFVSKNVY